MQPWVWGRMRRYGVQGTQSVRADDEPETRPIIGEEGSTLRLTTTERRLKPRTSPESQPRLGFTGASKKFCPSSFFFSVHCIITTEPGPMMQLKEANKAGLWQVNLRHWHSSRC